MTNPTPALRRSGLLAALIWLFPASRIKSSLLNRLGNEIADGVRIGPNIVLRCGPIRVGADATFGSLNTLRNLAELTVGPRAFFGNFNSVTAHPDYQLTNSWAGRLILKADSGITSRHYIDASGEVVIEPFAAIGGVQSVIQSHEIDLVANVPDIGRITLGEHALTATRTVLLKGASLPPRSLLSAGGVLTRSRTSRPEGLYAGNPAKWVKPIDHFAWMNRTEVHTPVPMGLVVDKADLGDDTT